jgi:signal transduction histidine kinase
VSKSDIPSAPVLYLRSADDAGLEAHLRTRLAGTTVEAYAFSTERWLHTLRGPLPTGLVVETNHLGLADLKLLEAGLASLDVPRPWLLLLVGDRGLAGCESLAAAPDTVALPMPWTPQGLEIVLARLDGSAGSETATTAAFDHAFLDGLVEGLRDPLTSISGYLQLIEHQDGEALKPLVDPAMQATWQIAEQLEALHLVAAGRGVHVGPVELGAVLEDFAARAGEQGQRVDLDLKPRGDAATALGVEADLRPLKAALRTGLLLLSRFGPGGTLHLKARRHGEEIRLILGSELGDANAEAAHEPPAYLEALFRRLVAAVPAEGWVDKAWGRMPVRVGVRWP